MPSFGLKRQIERITRRCDPRRCAAGRRSLDGSDTTSAPEIERSRVWRGSGGGSASEKGEIRDEALRRIEAVLFLTREPLPSRKLAQYANLADATAARTLVRRLNQLYDKNGRSFRVEEVAGGFQMLTRPKFAPWLRRLEQLPREVRLSAPALETLAIVAYRQPTMRADIEAIRGVSCGEILRQLMERDLVRIQGRSEELGRPYLYGTTKFFLQLFGLKSIDKLPRADEIRGLVPSVPSPSATAHDPSESPTTNELSPVSSTEEEREVLSTQELDTVEVLQQPDSNSADPSEITTAQHDQPRGELGDDTFGDDDDELDDDDDVDDDDDDDDDDDADDDDDFDDDEWEEVVDDDEDWDDEEDDDDDDDLDWEDDDDDDDDDLGAGTGAGTDDEEEDEDWE